jgi:hypothetical protein
MTLRRRDPRRERGSALFIAVMMLTLMGFLGLAALDRVTRDDQVAGYQNRARTAFYAAEAGISAGRRAVQEEGTNPAVLPAFPIEGAPRELADGGLFDREGGNLPRYFGDLTAGFSTDRCNRATPAAICFARKGAAGHSSLGMNAQQKAGKLDLGLWHIGVVGQSPDGSRARVAALATNAMPLSGTSY